MSFFPSNFQIQTQYADSRFQAAVLVGAPSFPNAIAWSDENLIAVASGHLVTILNPAALPFGPRGLITIPNAKSFPIGGVIDRKDLLSGCMLPTVLRRDPEPFARSISWSPVGLAPNGGCLLAVCTTQGLVKLYRQPYCDFSAEWIEVVDISAKLYDYLVSIDFGEVIDGPLRQCDANEDGMEVEIDSHPLKETNSNQIVRPSKYKYNSVDKVPENCTFPRITADQYASRTAILSSLVVGWSPMLKSPPKSCSVTRDCSSISLLAVGGKCGKVSLWSIPIPECYTVDQSRFPTTALLIGIFQAHNSWITAISWALLDPASSNPQLLLVTASSHGSVRIWLADNEQLLKASEPRHTSFSLLKEVPSVDNVPVSVLSVTVPAKSPNEMQLVAGKGSGSFELWKCNMCSQKFDRIGQYDAHDQAVTGLAWAFDGQSLYSCSQDNIIRCWILSGSSLREVPIPSNTPRLRSSTDLADGFVSCFGLAVSPGNLVISWVRNTDADQLNPMYEAKIQKAIAEFFWIGEQQVEVFSSKSPDFGAEAIPGFSEKELLFWESNFLWSLKQYETQDKPLAVWDIIAALLAFNYSKPEYVEHILITWLSNSYVGSHVGLSAEEVLLHVSVSFSKVTSRRLHLLNIICRRVMLSKMKVDEINSKLLNLEGVCGAEEQQSPWINLLLKSERELLERLVGLTFSAFLDLKPASAKNSRSGNKIPVGLAQMKQWVKLNSHHVQDQLKVLAKEVPKQERRLRFSKQTAEEKCSYCLASVPFKFPDVAFCQGKGHKLARCAISMEVCPTTSTWFCICCHRQASNLAPETLFEIPGHPFYLKALTPSSVVEVPFKPLCPFCGILLQRLQPDFLLSASPT